MSIIEIWQNIDNMIKNVQSIITSFYNFFVVIINFLPSPFNQILLSAIGIIIVIIVYKILKK